MRIEYETTLEDIADAHLRAAAGSKLARRERWQSTIWTAALAAFLLFLLLSVTTATLSDRCVFSGVAAVVGAGAHWVDYQRSMKRRVMKYLREQMETDGPMRFAVELRDDCIWTKQGENQLSFGWANVRDVLDSADGVEFRMRDGGYLIVRSRGFPSQEAREQFKVMANNKRIERDSYKGAAGGGLTEAVPP